MEIIGIINYIGEVEKVGEKQTEKVTLCLEESGKDYPNSLAVDVWGGKVELVNDLKIGDNVTVALNSKSREYNGKYYNSISAWKISKENKAKETPDSELPF